MAQEQQFTPNPNGGKGTWSNIITNNPSNSRPPSVTPSGGSSTTPDPESRLSENEVSTEATRDYIKSESNILSGQLEMREAKPKMKAKKTVSIQGIGGVLSGLYYVETVKNRFSKGGYEQSLTVTRKGFGDTIKKGNVQVPQQAKAPVSTREKSIPKITKYTKKGYRGEE